MKPNHELTVPKKVNRNQEVLARRGDQLQWFTRVGFKNIPAERDAAGKVIPNGGWIEVDPAAFTQPPDPVKPAEVIVEKKAEQPAVTETSTAASETPAAPVVQEQQTPPVVDQPVTNETGNTGSEGDQV